MADPTLREALLERDWPALAAFVAARLGVALDAEWYEFCLPRLHPGGWPLDSPVEGDLVIWLKRQLEGLPGLDAREVGAPAVRLVTRLHAGVTNVEETPEQVLRLRDEPFRARDMLEIARCRLSDETRLLAPIDRVAARVAPPAAGAAPEGSRPSRRAQRRHGGRSRRA